MSMDLQVGHLRETTIKFVYTPCVFLFLTSIAVFLRLYVRRYMIKSIHADDWFLLATFIAFAATSMCELMVGVGDLTDHSGDFWKSLARSGKLFMAGHFLYLLSTILLKITLGIFFLGIVVRPWQRLTIKLSVTIFVLYTFAYAFLYLFRCGAPPNYLNIFFVNPSCAISEQAMAPVNYIAAILNCLTDWMMAICPLFVISQLQLTRSAKASIYALTALGLLGSVVSMVRVPMVKVLAEVGSPNYRTGLATMSICSVVELGVGILCISLAALRPLLRKVMERVFGTVATGTNPYSAQEIVSKLTRSKGRTTSSLTTEKTGEVEVVVMPTIVDEEKDIEKEAEQDRGSR